MNKEIKMESVSRFAMLKIAKNAGRNFLQVVRNAILDIRLLDGGGSAKRSVLLMIVNNAGIATVNIAKHAKKDINLMIMEGVK